MLPSRDKIKQEPFLAANNALEMFSADLVELMCLRCANVRGPRLLHMDGVTPHHRGYLATLLASGKYPLTDAAIEHWAADEEHGLAHGFCTAFLAWLALPDIRNTPLLSRVVATALLHDFARGAGLVEQGHDEGLREVFDKMNPPAYWHTAPQAEALLVYADRVELLVIRTAAGGLSQGRWTWRSNATPGFDRCWMVSTAGSVP